MHLIRCDATAVKPTPISDKFKFNDRIALWDIFGKLVGTTIAPQNKQNFYKSRGKTRYKQFEILEP